jgi:CheY-like chemotaxis protein
VQLQARLIDDLLDITRIVQGKLELKRQRVNIAAVIDRAVEVSMPAVEAKKIEFSVALRSTEVQVDGDPLRLQQIVWNLLSNAIKFTPAGGRIELRCERASGHAVIELSDTGIGIDAEAMGRIFRAFEQGERTITRQYGGLGLGLAIVKRLVEMHNGTVAVRSGGRNKGSAFRVELPLSRALQEPSVIEPAPYSGRLPRLILLVEDDTDAGDTMSALLQTLGQRVKLARNVEQALNAIESASFDLMICDVGLPDRSGLELMRELRRRRYDLKAIALSGYGHDQDVQRSREAGFAAHLTKPVAIDLLVEIIAKVWAGTTVEMNECQPDDVRRQGKP